MKSLMVLVVGLLAVGCATVKDICVQLGISKSNAPEQKQKTLRDSVVGEYEQSWPDGTTHKLVFLENGVRKWYVNGNEQGNQKWAKKWAVVNGEIHVKYGGGSGAVFRVDAEVRLGIPRVRSITKIEYIEDGKRTDFPKDSQSTYKKIK